MKNIKAFDAHAHLSQNLEGVDDFLKIMDEVNIEKAIVIAGGTVPPDVLSRNYYHRGETSVPIGNAHILHLTQLARGRLLPFYFANPHEPADRYAHHAPMFFGLKLAPIVHGIPFKDPRIHDLLYLADQFGHPIYSHCLPIPGFLVADYVELAQSHPTCSFILGHGGLGHCDFDGIDQIKSIGNLFLETSGAFSRAVRYAIEVLGADRVVFGTETPLQDPAVEITKLERLHLSDPVYEKVMRGNIGHLVPALLNEVKMEPLSSLKGERPALHSVTPVPFDRRLGLQR